MSNSAEIEDTIVEVGGESKVHKDLSDVHLHIGGWILGTEYISEAKV